MAHSDDVNQTQRIDQQFALWRDLLLRTQTCDVGQIGEMGGGLHTLQRLMRLLSDADLLLSQMVGLGAVHVTITFAPEFGRQLVADARDDPRPAMRQLPAVDALERLIDAMGAKTAPISANPHMLLGLLAAVRKGRPFTAEDHAEDLDAIKADAEPHDLLVRLGMIKPGDPLAEES